MHLCCCVFSLVLAATRLGQSVLSYTELSHNYADTQGQPTLRIVTAVTTTVVARHRSDVSAEPLTACCCQGCLCNRQLKGCCPSVSTSCVVSSVSCTHLYVLWCVFTHLIHAVCVYVLSVVPK